MVELEFCGHDWETRFVDVIQAAQSDLFLCSPYISRYGCDIVLEHVAPACRDSGMVTIVTDLSPNAICQGSTEPEAIRRVAHSFPELRIRHLPRLHAKVYVADSKAAIVTSGNLTADGLRKNHEYGVHLSDSAAVARIRDDIGSHAELGAQVHHYQLDEYTEIAQDLRSTYEKARRSMAATSRRRFRTVTRRAEDELVRLRLAGGAMHTVFAETALYMLRRMGPLTTPQLHVQIERVHSDLCDNSVDRVIDGKRFGKKWKHAARTAQQQLKKRGLIERRDDRWYANQEANETPTNKL